jgi:aryl-alcohol dehydrogenase-like predicted oxidoreductase
MLPQRAVGDQGLMLPAIGVGCMGLTSFYGCDTLAANPVQLIRRAVDLGAYYLDTSDAYGPHLNEQIVGQAIRGLRERVIVSTKFGLERDALQADGLTATTLNGRPDYVKRSCDASLLRLGIDYIDLYIQHRRDPATPIEETVGAMGELVAEGKVRYIALCEVGPRTIRRAHTTFPLSAVHAEYSLWNREPEAEILPLLHDLHVGFLPYSPLGRGFLTGRIRRPDDLAPDDWRRHSPRFQGENFTRNLKLVARIHELAETKGVAPAQLALAWILHKGDGIVPIQGATRDSELVENLRASEITLSGAEMAAIDAAAPLGAAAGDAWPSDAPGAVHDRE